MNTTELRNALQGSALNDVLLIGFVDQSVLPLRFHTMLQTIYFDFGSILLELQAVDTTGTMRVSFVSAVRHNFELEEGMVAAVTSVREQVLRDADGPNLLASVQLWRVNTVDGELRCSAAQFELANGQHIFVDPTYHFGIRMGGEEQKQLWQANWRECADDFAQLLMTTES